MPGPDKLFPLLDFSHDYLDWGRSEFGGSGNYLWAFTDDLTWVKEATPGSSGSSSSRTTTTGTAGTRRRAPTTSTAGRPPASCRARSTRPARRQRVRELPARRGAVFGDYDQSLRVGPVAMLLRVRAGRLARQRQADAQLRRALSTPRRPSRATIPTATRTSTRRCRIPPPTAGSGLGVRR